MRRGDRVVSSARTNLDPRAERSLKGMVGEARTQILLWYAGLFLLLGSLAVPAFRWVLFRRVDARVREDLIEQVRDFKTELEAGSRDAPAAIGRFVATTLPEDDNFFIFFLDGQFYTSSPQVLPADLQPETDPIQDLSQRTEAVEGRRPSDNPEIQSLIYVVEPIHSPQGEAIGTFIGAHAAAGERREALEGTIVFAQVMLVSIAAAFVFSWLISGRVLAPVRELTATAREIGEAGLEQRLDVRGRGEMATLAETFNAMLDRLQGVIVSQRDFISDAGHELRTPLTIVRGHLELMGDDPDEQQEAIEVAIDELDRLSRMVDEMSLLAKSERPDFVRPTLVTLTDFTHSLYSKAKTLGERDWQLVAVADGRVWADPQRLTEAVVNLVQNAVEHTHPGDRIALGSALEADTVRFWVCDAGPGIAPEHQQRIFERFVRIGKSTSHSTGAGLGLPIVAAIAEAHGGRIELASEPGAGATFTLTIPRKIRSHSALVRGVRE